MNVKIRSSQAVNEILIDGDQYEFSIDTKPFALFLEVQQLQKRHIFKSIFY